MSSTDAISCPVFGSATRLRSAIELRRSQAEEAVTVPARASHRFGDLGKAGIGLAIPGEALFQDWLLARTQQSKPAALKQGPFSGLMR